ncbi:MAG: threonylcarbamoyl-AMP synthase [Gemmatimonadetes bacterium]|nr:threonylcarbamoyl-AMP synthase [Gemmatimonadota bacterium]
MATLAARVLAEGGLVAFPTDTVYGLGADVMNRAALARLFQVKNRPAGRPVPVLLGEREDAGLVAARFPEGAWRLALRFWPGPLTIVVPRAEAVPAAVSGGRDTVGLRVPDHEAPRAIVRALGRPVTGTSANRSGNPPHTDPEGVALDLGGAVDLIVPGRCGGHGAASTVVDFSGEVPVVVREGPIKLAALREVWPGVQAAPGDRGFADE